MTTHSAGPPTMVDIEHLPLAAAVVDADGLLVGVNAAMIELVGGDDTHQMIADLYDREVWAAVARIMAGPSAGTNGPTVEAREPADASLMPLFPSLLGPPCFVRHPKSGVAHQVWVSTRSDGASSVVIAAPASAPLSDLDGADSLAAMAAIDDAAARAHELLGHGVVVGDGQRLLHVSEGAARLFGRSSADLLEIGSLFGLLEPDEQVRLTQVVEERRRLGMDPLEHFETTLVRPGGSLLPVELWVKAKVEGETVRTYTLIADARERRAQHDQLAHRALHDQLTGLPNRSSLMDRLETELDRLDRQGGSAMLAFIDLDGFKEVNDDHGHPVGDVVLRATAERLRSGLRSCDTVARMGGDEFVVLCGDSNDHQLTDALTERLRELVCRSVVGDGWSVDVRASIGVVAFDDGALDAETLLAHADLVMYASKRDQAERVSSGSTVDQRQPLIDP